MMEIRGGYTAHQCDVCTETGEWKVMIDRRMVCVHCFKKAYERTKGSSRSAGDVTRPVTG